jgi:hypothetical protein
MFGPKRDEVTGGWRKLHYEELYNVYSSPNKIRMIKLRRMRLAGYVARRIGRGIQMGYWWERKRPLGRPRRRWWTILK